MKSEHIPLTVAMIAAAASLIAVLFNQYGAHKLEQEKWRQAQQDSIHTVIVDLAKELSAAHQRAEWLVWYARSASDLLADKDMDDFDNQAKTSLPRIIGFRVLLSAKEPAAHAALDELIKGFFETDACVGLASAVFRRNQTSGIAQLLLCEEAVNRVTKELTPAFTAAIKASNSQDR